MLHNNEVISIEEASYHIRPNCSVRRFTLKNNVTNFEVTIKTTGATIISCKINKDELIRLDNDENQQTNSLTNRNQSTLIQLNGGFEWQSHVLGLDSISFATNAHHNSTITYQLNELNELLILGKLRSVNHLSYLVPFYFNLNTSSSTVDGHFLHIKAIKLDKSDQNSTDSSLSFSLSSDNTNNDFHSSFIKSPNRVNWSNTQDKNVYDLVYTLNGKYKEASILAILSYGSKRIEFSIQNTLNSYSNQMTNSFNQLANSSSQTNTQNLCKLRIKLSQYGISLLPASMYEFKAIYKFHF